MPIPSHGTLMAAPRMRSAARRIAQASGPVSFVKSGMAIWTVVRSWITRQRLDEVGDDAYARDGAGVGIVRSDSVPEYR